MSYGGGGKLQWLFNSRGKVTLKHTGTMETTLSKVAWQITLSPTKRETNPYRYMQPQAITHLHQTLLKRLIQTTHCLHLWEESKQVIRGKGNIYIKNKTSLFIKVCKWSFPEHQY